jgi:uncharacterized phage protein (predicted DNA packaging)
MMQNWPDKDPDEIIDYAVDWSARLGIDTITSSAWILQPGITEDSSSNTTTTTTIWLSGGTAGITYAIVNRVETLAGRTFEEAISIRITPTVNQLVSIDEVKQMLRIDHADDDATLEMYIAAASLSIVAYLKDPTLLSVDSPPEELDARVKSAVIMLVGYWYKSPDGNPDGAFERGYLPMPITAMLYPMRDPTLA